MNSPRNKSRRHGFTLVELLIVVVILAILAATVIPQFTVSSDDAKESSLRYNLHTLRAQIELYKVHHNNLVPTLTAGKLTELTAATTADGTVDENGEYGPYLVGELPPNPLTGINTVTATATFPPAAASGTGGWLYHADTGGIWADADEYLEY